MTHDYKYENMSEEDRNSLIPTIRSILRIPKISEEELKRIKNHCTCRSGSPDTCPICTDMETGEKFATQDHCPCDSYVDGDTDPECPIHGTSQSQKS